jgi:Straboviridae dCMP hydroxymethylase
MTPLYPIPFRTQDIRDAFIALLHNKKFTSVNRESSMTSLVGNTTIEIVGASFIADEPSIFGKVDEGYVKREEEWYYSMSLNVNDIPGGTPAAWKACADKDGFINSNYGWTCFSPENGFEAATYYERGYKAFGLELPAASLPGRSQYECAVNELKKNPESRRAVIIYTRPTMWMDYNSNGRSDFMCTNAVQYMIRDGKLHAVVQMRSNDAVWGYKNDRAWQQHVLEKMGNELSVPVGNLYWNAGSLHIYSRHYHLVDPVNYPAPVKA